MFNQSYEVYITPLVISSLGRGHTHTHTHTQTRIPTIRTGSILRNQAHAWFKTIVSNNFKSMHITATQMIAHYSINFDPIQKSLEVLAL